VITQGARTIQLAGGGELLLDEAWLPAGEAARLFLALVAETPWRQEEVIIAGRAVMQPRLTAWYGDAGAAYTYSGLTVHPLPWTATLAALRARVERDSGHAFNSVLLNHYRDGQDAMGMHADDEKELGKNPVIASVSLGGTRRFVMKYRKRGPARSLRPTAGKAAPKTVERSPPGPDDPPADVELRLGSGSLLVMAGTTQHYWKHGVPRQGGDVGPRINLTFRRILAG
jgi:alkylated DNA repair dioxygenase AlkB